MSSTPGPWIIGKTEQFTMIYPLNHPEENICEVMGNMANAPLIAAAPALLEALKSLADHLDYRDAAQYHGSTDIVKRARAAIAAADGE